MSRHLIIDTDSAHKLNVVVTGDESKIPVVIFHGGPGSKSKEKHIQLYDFEQVFTIQIDQRGNGESSPAGEIKNNTTQDLISDIELVRSELGVQKWIVAGGSWGSTLALLYAQAHPEKVLGLYIASVFLARGRDTDWLFGAYGATRFFPDVWAKRNSLVEEYGFAGKDDFASLFKILNEGAFEEQQKAASVIGSWEGNIMTLESIFEFPSFQDVTEKNINNARLFLHYHSNNYFIEENQILDNMGKIEGIPMAIAHGRFDMVCPPEQAFLVSERSRNCVLEYTNFDSHKLSQESKRFVSYLFKNLLTRI